MKGLTEVWSRNSFDVEAVRITEENIQKVAEWCDGNIYGFRDYDLKPLRMYVQFGSADGERVFVAKAYIGDWIILVDDVFKRFTDKKFRQLHSPVVSEMAKQADVEKILGEFVELHKEALQQGVDSPMELFAPGIAQKIVNLFAE